MRLLISLVLLSTITIASAAPDSRIPSDKGPLAPLVRMSDESDPDWEKMIAPIRDQDPDRLLDATRFKQLSAVREAMERVRQMNFDPNTIQMEWPTYCHYWPAVPGTLEPWRLVPMSYAPANDWPFDGDYRFAATAGPEGWDVVTPYQHGDASVRFWRRTLSFNPINSSPNGRLTANLNPEHPLIAGRTEAQQAPFISEYARYVAQGEDAYYAELFEQTQGTLSDGVHGLQDFPQSLDAACLANGMTLAADAAITTSPDAPADLQLFFDGTQCYRLRLTFPSGLVLDEVKAFTQLSIRHGVTSSRQARVKFEEQNPRTWQFIGGIKLPAFEDRVKHTWARATTPPT